MTHEELKRYVCSEAGGGEMLESRRGEYVRFADVQALQAARDKAVWDEALENAALQQDDAAAYWSEAIDRLKGRAKYLAVGQLKGHLAAADAIRALKVHAETPEIIQDVIIKLNDRLKEPKP